MKALIKWFVLTVLSISIAAGQLNVSDTFQKTLKRIAKEKVKSEVISWITEQDPITGIVARDLIAQLLDGKDEGTLLRSTTNVITTMMFLGGIKRHVETLVDSTTGIEEQATSAGWTRDQLVGYSCLYYFYSERLKNNLYVSPEILKMSEEKSKIESFKSEGDRKWTVIVSAKLIGLRRSNNDLSVDVRALEVLDKSLWLLISDQTHFGSHSDSIFQSFAVAFESDRSFSQAIESVKSIARPGRIIENLFTVYQKAYEKSYGFDRVFRAVQGEAPEDESQGSNALLKTYSNLLITSHYAYVDHEQSRSTILGIIRDLLEHWMSQSRKDGWKVDYVFSLAGSGIGGGGSANVDFTILDQIRFVRHFETTRFFIYFGGFFDPLFKSTINKTGAKLYMTGLGFGWHSAFIAFSAGMQYPEVMLKNTRFAITLGYEIPIDEILN
jgi:hypothetical protein